MDSDGDIIMRDAEEEAAAKGGFRFDYTSLRKGMGGKGGKGKSNSKADQGKSKSKADQGKSKSTLEADDSDSDYGGKGKNRRIGVGQERYCDEDSDSDYGGKGKDRRIGVGQERYCDEDSDDDPEQQVSGKGKGKSGKVGSTSGYIPHCLRKVMSVTCPRRE